MSKSVTAAIQGFHPTPSAAVLARLVLLRRIASVKFREEPRMLWAGEAYRYAYRLTLVLRWYRPPLVYFGPQGIDQSGPPLGQITALMGVLQNVVELWFESHPLRRLT